MAVQSAGLILVKSNPLDTVRILILSAASYRKQLQNIWWGPDYNIVMIPLAAGVLAPFGFIMPPSVGAVLISISTIVVAVNAQLLRRVDLSLKWPCPAVLHRTFVENRAYPPGCRPILGPRGQPRLVRASVGGSSTVQELGLTRRRLLGGAMGAGTVAALAACGVPRERASAPGPTATATGSPPMTGAVRTYTLTSTPTDVDLGGTVLSTWAYGSTIPGTALRATAGDRVQIAYSNALPVPSSVHWHGLAIDNAMDGVPGVTTPEVPPGGRFAFDFVVPDPGTHWFHPHTGLQLDRGLGEFNRSLQHRVVELIVAALRRPLLGSSS